MDMRDPEGSSSPNGYWWAFVEVGRRSCLREGSRSRVPRGQASQTGPTEPIGHRWNYPNAPGGWWPQRRVGWAHSSVRGATVLVAPVASGLGYALFVNAVARYLCGERVGPHCRNSGGSKYNGSFESEILSRFSIALGARAIAALKNIGSRPRPLGDIYPRMHVDLHGSVGVWAFPLELSLVSEFFVLLGYLQVKTILLDSGTSKLEEEGVSVGVPASVCGGLGSCYLGMGALDQRVATSPKPSEDLWGPERWLSHSIHSPTRNLFSNPSSYWCPWDLEHGPNLQLG
ncbi:hypothetical protein CRG98_012344 [Punica granatum]|uniref:Uncharacterized protein n=1 Tax=Punica granatum TaxID=22663 RepID=A0A2I0KFK4_PUNGR|nr:hypothetical protein CRG98_012344 [Punica granatum]